MKNINDFNDYINSLVSEFEGEGTDYSDYNDYAHERADGSEYVIYYSKAWDLVNMIRACDYSLYCDSETWAVDLGTELESLDHAIVMTAYAIIHNAIIDTFNNQEQERDDDTL